MISDKNGRRPAECSAGRRLILSKSITFWQGVLQSAARIICAPPAHKFHTCSLRSIFFAAHVAEENDRIFFAPACAKATRFVDKLDCRPAECSAGRRFSVLGAYEVPAFLCVNSFAMAKPRNSTMPTIWIGASGSPSSSTDMSTDTMGSR